MALLPETRDALARYDEWLARTVKAPERMAVQARRMRRTARSAGRRLRNMLFGALAVVLAAFAYGNLVAPLGFLGVVAMLLGVLAVMALLAGWPAEKPPSLETLPEAPIASLPATVETWLDMQRPALPAPAARAVDDVMAQLDRLKPELARLDAASPQAEDARRLLGDHLPRLVKTYVGVPETHRAKAEAQAHFREGLKVVGAEIDRLTGDLARERLQALETEGRFLESRYGPPTRK